MSDFFEKLGTVVAGILIFSLMLLYFWGVYYGFQRHGVRDGLITVFVPPYSFYRGVSYFWEDPQWKDNYYEYTQNIAILLELSSRHEIDKNSKLKKMEVDTEKWIDNLPKQEERKLKEKAYSYSYALIAYYTQIYKQIDEGLTKDPLKNYLIEEHVINFNDVEGFKKIWNKFNINRKQEYKFFKNMLQELDENELELYKERLNNAKNEIQLAFNITEKQLNNELQILFSD